MHLSGASAKGLGKWVWSNSAFSTDEARQQLVQFCVEHQIGHIDIYIRMSGNGDKRMLRHAEALSWPLSFLQGGMASQRLGFVAKEPGNHRQKAVRRTTGRCVILFQRAGRPEPLPEKDRSGFVLDTKIDSLTQILYKQQAKASISGYRHYRRQSLEIVVTHNATLPGVLAPSHPLNPRSGREPPPRRPATCTSQCPGPSHIPVAAAEEEWQNTIRVAMKPGDGEIKVFISSRESTCSECGEALGSHAWITLAGDRGVLCLTCADMDHLLFLPSGDVALTRRAKKNSRLHAVVLKWSRTRKRYERRGLLVEEHALEQAETECLADAEIREIRRMREAEKRDSTGKAYVKEYAEQIRRRYPRLPPSLEIDIAEHACLKYSGRVGRSERAKRFDEESIALAVAAHVRHAKTEYDDLLMRGIDRHDARRLVRDKVGQILKQWRQDPEDIGASE